MPAADIARHRFALTLALLFALQAAVAAVVWLIAGSALEAEARLALLAALAFVLLLALGWSVKRFFDAYPLPLARLREDLALLEANPAHRIAPQGAQRGAQGNRQNQCAGAVTPGLA